MSKTNLFLYIYLQVKKCYLRLWVIPSSFIIVFAFCTYVPIYKHAFYSSTLTVSSKAEIAWKNLLIFIFYFTVISKNDNKNWEIDLLTIISINFINEKQTLFVWPRSNVLQLLTQIGSRCNFLTFYFDKI